MKKIITLLFALLLVAGALYAQDTKANASDRWEVLVIGSPVFLDGDDSPGGNVSLQVGKNLNSHVSLGLRPSFGAGRNDKRRAALQFYAKYRKPFNPRLNWFIQTQLGYGYRQETVWSLTDPETFFETGILRQEVERSFWETRLDIAYGLEVRLWQNFQGLVTVNTGYGLELGFRSVF